MHHPHPVLWLRTHPRGADALLAAIVTVVAVVVHLNGDGAVAHPRADVSWWTVLLILAGTVPLYWRRTHPLPAGLVIVAAEVSGLLIGLSGDALVGSVIAVYSIGAHSVGVRRTRVVTAISIMLLGLFVAGWIDGLALIDEFVSTGVVLVTAFVVGDNLRRRRQHVADLAERAERAEREQGLLAEKRVNAERTRIARDLHDVVAHSVSMMVIQAAAARRNLDTDPEAATAALISIESTGRQTMNELRGILGVLRTGQTIADLDPQPSLTLIDGLVAADDLPIFLSLDGSIADLPESVSVTGYRLVQEALTNVRRHAGPVDRVDVKLRVESDRLSIEVSDNGRGAGVSPTTDGFGMIGMRERAAAVGGTVEAGPRAGGGWRVRSSVPLRVDSAVEAVGAAAS
jgi:signal transduction histidine kinase